jgi:hypothetical protein
MHTEGIVMPEDIVARLIELVTSGVADIGAMRAELQAVRKDLDTVVAETKVVSELQREIGELRVRVEWTNEIAAFHTKVLWTLGLAAGIGLAAHVFTLFWKVATQ